MKKILLLILVSLLVIEVDAQISFECNCETKYINEIYCDLEEAGYRSINGTILSTVDYASDCPCEEELVGVQGNSNTNSLIGSNNSINNSTLSSNPYVVIEGNGYFIEDYFNDFENYLNGSANINIYDLSDICQNFDEVLNGPTNTADFNFNIVLIDHENDDCDVIYIKEISGDPCGSGFTVIDRSDFQIPSYSQGNLKAGDKIYYSFIDNKFQISSSSPTANYTELQNTSNLVFEINSYISQFLFDGPWAPWTVCGEKLISYVEIIPTYDVLSNSYKYDLKSSYKIGTTGNILPWILTGRDYFEGLMNMALNVSQTSSYSGCYEQYASVPEFEEFGLNTLGYDIVNVAQKAQIEISNDNQIVVKFLTDIFPSADFILFGKGDFFLPNENSRKLEVYDQPSFEDTHCLISKGYCPDDAIEQFDCTIINTSKRPDPLFYCRFPE